CARRDWFRRGIHHGSSDQCQGRQQQHPHGHPQFPHHHSHAPGADKSIKKRHGRIGTQRKLRRIGGTRCHQHHHGCDIFAVISVPLEGLIFRYFAQNHISMKAYWWKILAILLVLYSIIMGLLGHVPALPIVNETIRNVYFHVPMWFTMFTLYTISVVYSVKYLSSANPRHDFVAVESVNVGIVFCIFGLLTGMLWANFTWGAPWPNDPKLNGSA